MNRWTHVAIALLLVAAPVCGQTTKALELIPDDALGFLLIKDLRQLSDNVEHLADKLTLLDTLTECRRVLRPDGLLLVLMPNLRAVKQRYWDYFDHQLPLTHLSLVEGMRTAAFEPVRVIARFLPYTVKRMPIRVRPGLVRAYLRLPILWPFAGGQMFVAARKRD